MVKTTTSTTSNRDDDGTGAKDVDGDERLTTRQAARLVGVTEERMRTLAGDGRVTATLVKHQWWFSRQELEELKAETPAVLYTRRRPERRPVSQQRREQSRAAMLRLHATQDPHEAARRGYLGLLAKIAREIDPRNILSEDERDRRVQLEYRARMAEVRAQRTAGRKLQTTQERIAALEAEQTHALEQRAQRQAQRHAPVANQSNQGNETSTTPAALTICFDCWREHYSTRPPRGLVNAFCARHQRDLDAFAAEIRGDEWQTDLRPAS